MIFRQQLLSLNSGVMKIHFTFGMMQPTHRCPAVRFWQVKILHMAKNGVIRQQWQKRSMIMEWSWFCGRFLLKNGQAIAMNRKTTTRPIWLKRATLLAMGTADSTEFRRMAGLAIACCWILQMLMQPIGGCLNVHTYSMTSGLMALKLMVAKWSGEKTRRSRMERQDLRCATFTRQNM